MNKLCLQGIGISGGVVTGKIYKYQAYTPVVLHQYSQDSAAELAQYNQVRQAASQELNAIIARLESAQAAESAIFIAQLDFLDDEDAVETITAHITDESYTAQYAIEQTYTQFAQVLAQIDDEMISARQADVMDICNRLLRLCNGVKEANLSMLSEPVVVVAYDLLPSDTATLNRKNVLAIVTQAGNITSHTAIIAQTYNIPAVLGVNQVLETVSDGDTVLVDASDGVVMLHPTAEDLAAMEHKQALFLEKKESDQRYRLQKLQTLDGIAVEIGVNIGTIDDEVLSDVACADFVGLFRTEFLFMQSKSLPTEDEQFKAYRKVLTAFDGKRVVLRTIDIGGDKSIPYLDLPKEDNPFLGVRAMRLCYAQPELLKTQLRAALRASVFGKLAIMFPMITSVEEILWAKELVCEAKAALDAQGLAYSDDVQLGIMMEIPSIMLVADSVVDEVDFASIGTNDLCQYLTATDRLNSNASRYYQTYHPGMLRLIGQVSQVFTQAGKPLSVCGELGGDAYGAPILLGLGVKKLSMNGSSIGATKRILSGMSLQQLQEMSAHVLTLKTQQDVVEFVKQATQPDTQ